MDGTIPVAGTIVVEPQVGLVPVESAPESERTRSFKDVARYVYRLVQDVRWSEADRAVSVRIAGESSEARAVALNVGLLLAPLLDIGLEAHPEIAGALELDDGSPASDVDVYPNPRDRVWLVPAADLDRDAAAERFGLTIGTVADGFRADLLLVLMPQSERKARVSASIDADELAAVIVGGSAADVPVEVAIEHARG